VSTDDKSADGLPTSEQAARLDAERTRDDLEQTLDEIEQRLKPQALAQSAQRRFQENPAAVLGVAAGIAAGLVGLIVWGVRRG